MTAAGEMRVFCDPTIASCAAPDGRELNFSEYAPQSEIHPPIIDAFGDTWENGALAYSIAVQTNVVGTVDDIRHIAEDECDTRIREKTHLPRGIVRDTLVMSCLAGGMISQLPRGLASLPSRIQHAWSQWNAGTAEGKGEALASIPFFLIEGAGYSQMATGAAATFKGGVPAATPAETQFIAGVGGMSGGAGVAQASWVPAFATAGDICIASGDMTMGVTAASSSDDFGGPMGKVEPVQMSGQGGASSSEAPFYVEDTSFENIARVFSEHCGREGVTFTVADIEAALRRFFLRRWYGTATISKMQIEIRNLRWDGTKFQGVVKIANAEEIGISPGTGGPRRTNWNVNIEFVPYKGSGGVEKLAIKFETPRSARATVGLTDGSNAAGHRLPGGSRGSKGR